MPYCSSGIRSIVELAARDEEAGNNDWA
eukprot:SAG31_NODE_29987_length_387_cov_0.506944_1_plen_27_part_01